MTTVLIVIHLMVVLAMIALVLLQRSEGGALGMGGGGGGGGGMMSGRGVGNLLTRTTGILAVAFFATSIGLTILAKVESESTNILGNLPGSESAPAPIQQPAGGQVQTPPSDGGSVLDSLRQQSGIEATPQTPPAEGNSQ